MIDDSRTLAVRLGKAKNEAMFARQAVASLDDSEFLPMLEAVLTAYEDVLSDAAVAEELWECAFAVYDRLCKEAQPTWTTADNRKLMRSYLLGRRGRRRQSQPTGKRREKPAVPGKEKPAPANPTRMSWTFGLDIPTFIDSLRESKDSVAFLRLTLESLGAMVLLPAKDQPLFIALMKERLALHSNREPIAGVL